MTRFVALVTAVTTLFVLTAAASGRGAGTQLRHSPRFLVVKKLQSGLRGTPLAVHAFRLEAEGWRWNINPFLVASIAGTESSFGAAACGGNAWGLGNCGFSFATFPDGIRYATKLLRTSYLDKGYRTLSRVGARYAACGPCWAERTGWYMRARFGSPPTLTYPGERAV